MELTPCPWAQGEDYLDYHDNEWGVPQYDAQKLFEKLCLEGQQAGLSWITVLRKRDRYRQQFFDFDPKKIAKLSDADIEQRLQDTGLIRNKLKLFGIRKNALAYLKLVEEGVGFSEWIWSFIGGEPVINRFASMKEIPTETDEAKAMSKALKKAGFTFVGPTICYAFMQSMGMVNDHLTNCPKHPDNL